MSNTYSGNPSSSARDLLRFRIGDTGPTTWLLSDEELDYVVVTYASQTRREAECLEAIGNKLLQQPNFALDKWRENRHDVAMAFLARADRLRKQSAAQGLYAGGTSVADKAKREKDTDQPKPWAKIGMDDTVPPSDELVSSD